MRVESTGMHRRTAAVASLIALLALLAVPSGDACPVDSATPHDCCASVTRAPAPESDSCCSTAEDEPSGRVLSTSGVLDPDCHCIHAPAAPTGAAVGTPTPNLDGVGSAATRDAAVLPSAPRIGPPVLADPVARSAPPPLYVLDCAFLI